MERRKAYDCGMGNILFVDIGGTLIDYTNRLPHSAVEALRAARSNGHKVYLSTGRSIAEVTQELWNIGVDGLIGAQGAYVESHQQVVYHRGLSGEENRQVVDWLKQRGCEFYLESNNGLYASPNFEEEGDALLRRMAEEKGIDEMTTRDFYPNMIWNENLYRDDVNKISYILNSYDDFEDTRSHFPDLEHSTWGNFGEDALFGSVGVGGVSKHEAVNRLLKFLNARREDTIAFGDSSRDLSLFEASARGVAVGRTSVALTEAADLVTESADNDGLAKAFIELGLIEKDQVKL